MSLRIGFFTATALMLLLIAASSTFQSQPQQFSEQSSESFIVMANSLVDAKIAAQHVGAEITHELGIINAVAVQATSTQRDALASLDAVVQISANAQAETGHKKKDEEPKENEQAGQDDPIDEVAGQRELVPVSMMVDAIELHEVGITGEGITVAVLDTGIREGKEFEKNLDDEKRILAQYDAISDVYSTKFGKKDLVTEDGSGHGMHVASIIANSKEDKAGRAYGIAPDVNLVIVKAFSAEGVGTYADVIRGLDLLIEKKDELNLRVINLSFYSTPQSHYWEDPLNQAVMRAWQEGIVVVTGSGNTGPDAMTIGVPGNVPYVITVGAYTDNYTPTDQSDDYIPPFSSAGPTYDGFVKPEIIAPGAHILGKLKKGSAIRDTYPEREYEKDYYELSGTSMSSAVTSGIVALMLQNDPSLTPDDVKCRLIDSAQTALDENGELAFSVFQQGAGAVNAVAAVKSTASGCANGGLDISADLGDKEHYIGPVVRNEAGEFVVLDGKSGESLAWDGIYAESGGTYFWSGGTYFWSGGTYFWSGSTNLWSGGTYFWSGGTYFWSGGTYFWSGADLDPLATKASVSIVEEQ